jgi:hypothetical protein
LLGSRDEREHSQVRELHYIEHLEFMSNDSSRMMQKALSFSQQKLASKTKKGRGKRR